MTLFRDRVDAGRSLARRLSNYGPDTLVLALPRGGVPVASEVAKALGAPFDVFLVRKLGVPGHEELAMGAISSGGVKVLNQNVVRSLQISEQEVAATVKREETELLRREHLYRGERPLTKVEGRAVILIDDGVATGATMRAAILALRQQNPAWLVVAVPVGAPDTCERLRHGADEVVCVATPEPFYSVGRWYEMFPQISDEEVQELLSRAC
jgi:putative phosphoribosyl transferase